MRLVAVGRRTPDAVAGDLHGAVAEPVDGEVAAEGEGAGGEDWLSCGHAPIQPDDRAAGIRRPGRERW